jgi:hypothetical protein
MTGLLLGLSFWDGLSDIVGSVFGMMQDAGVWVWGWMVTSFNDAMGPMVGSLNSGFNTISGYINAYAYPVLVYYNVANAFFPVAQAGIFAGAWITWKSGFLAFRTVKKFIPMISG